MDFRNHVKTWALMALLGALFVAIGGLIGGQSGLVIALVFAVLLNGVVYWKSDALALRANGARPLGPDEEPRVHAIITVVARRMGLPVPRLHLVERPEPNAFATGRSPSHSAVAVTSGLLALMDDRQLAGVLAHEMSHIRNRDTLIGTVAATIGGAISMLAQMAQFQMIFGGGDDDEGSNPLALLGAIILAPIAALIIQLAVSRSREYLADRTGVEITGDPESLAQALEKLEAASHGTGLVARMRGRRPQGQARMNPAFAHLYIVNPLAGVSMSSLFASHPPIAERAARLRAMRQNRISQPISTRIA